jgi:hypothetical protein
MNRKKIGEDPASVPSPAWDYQNSCNCRGICSLPKLYKEQESAKFLAACDPSELAMFATYLLTGFREQEGMYLFWSDVSFQLRTIRDRQTGSRILSQTP